MWLSFALSIIRCIAHTSASEHQVVLSRPDSPTPNHGHNVAIIGAGAAGSSSAYHLAQFAAAAEIPINVTVFERESYVGGRSTTVNAYDDPNWPIELGASIFVKVNYILVNASKSFNLTTSSFGAAAAAARTVDAPSLGIWDGNRFIVTLSSSGPTWWDTARLLYRYGLAPVRTMSLMKSTVGKFLTMYDEPVFPFHSLTAAAERVGLIDATSSQGVQFVTGNGVSALYAHDIIQASSRVNYAQNLENFHGLETMVCMASDGAMAIEGGNWQIFDRMLSTSGATLLLETNVTAVSTTKDGLLTVNSKSALRDGNIEELRSEFDAVIIAAPFQSTGISLELDSDARPEHITYVKLHVTLFTSSLSLSPSFFGLAADAAVPRTVLTTLPCEATPGLCFHDDGTAPDFFSISLLSTVENPKTGDLEYAYKVFSHTPPSDEWLAALLGVHSDAALLNKHITWLHRKLWHSYPLETPRERFQDIELADDLWYTAGMETFISTMETSALMGKNVARLIVDKWQRRV